MPRLLKRTVTTTEELLDDKDLSGLDDLEDGDGDEVEQDDPEEGADEKPARRRRR